MRVGIPFFEARNLNYFPLYKWSSGDGLYTFIRTHRRYTWTRTLFPVRKRLRLLYSCETGDKSDRFTFRELKARREFVLLVGRVK